MLLEQNLEQKGVISALASGKNSCLLYIHFRCNWVFPSRERQMTIFKKVDIKISQTKNLSFLITWFHQLENIATPNLDMRHLRRQT